MKVWYMNGAGNDFMVIDGRGMGCEHSALAKKLCALTGADGFMAVDASEIADFRLHFYNADGSRGEMCGNGSRCICRFAWENGLAGEEMSIQTDAGIVRGEKITDSQYRVQLNLPGIVDLRRKEDISYVELGAPGVPHAILEQPDLCWEDREKLRSRASSLRYDPAFPKGANVNFYRWLDESTVRILTYERGVEDYTLACGTGSAATAVTLFLQGKLPGKTLTVKNPGGDLTVTLEADPSITAVYLQGETEIVEIFDL